MHIISPLMCLKACVLLWGYFGAFTLFFHHSHTAMTKINFAVKIPFYNYFTVVTPVLQLASNLNGLVVEW